ncbi:MupA/Atu3671 family FMN-dependent luciferase-like monooxygenase [Streptosporangium sp. CA-135522]|uniref:MupA/Atu3671 family FMN-dependent luciferase-like monooxygenase n=1 Tax=Streptosporangium sp. CA-135522 TaxID=3240072 RepID=UPI003D945B23
MKPIDLLSRLRAAGVDLWVDGERLRFSAPPGALTPELRNALGEHRAEVMDLLRRAPGPAAAIARAERGEPLSVSFPQRRMWFFEQVHPGTATYHMTASSRITGDLDVDALHRAFTALADRHETLRTAFELREDDPVQLIADSVDIPLPVIDLTALEDDQRRLEADRLLAAECARPFDLAEAPLLRTTLLRMDDDVHVLTLTIHHIIADMWSLDVLMRELAALYAGEEPPPLPVQYADFAVWQRSLLQGEAMGGQLDYWTGHLAGAPSFLELPTDRPRPQTSSFAGGRQSAELPADLVAGMDALCRREGATRFMGLLAAFAVLLSRYSGETDLLLGSPIANRTRAETENLIGFFVNTLVLRVDLSGAPTFTELLRRVREVALGAYENQDVPVERLVEVLHPRRDASRPPLFQTMFTLQNTDMSPLELAGLAIEPLPGRRTATEFDLTLEFVDSGTESRANVQYNADIFDDDTMRRLLGNWRTLLEAAVADPERVVSELPTVSGEERALLLDDWNATAEPYPISCVHERVAAQARLTPDAPAVHFRDRELTYAELDGAADALAARLSAVGVRGGPPVAVCVERSPEMIVSLLAVLKAGAAYLPIDTTLPPERLSYMLQDAGVSVVVTSDAQRHRFADMPVRQVLADVDDGGPRVSDPVSVSASDLAYVIYTSGSTGRPKGVMLEHGNLANFLSAMDDVLDEREPGVWLALTGVSFDIAVLELLWPLTRGWQVVVQDDGDVLPGGGARASVGTLDFGLFYFAVSEDQGDGYRLLVEGAKFADRNGFTAVWTPERHFDPFGGFYPNPSVTSAALATITQRIQLRAGSVVLPLHNPIRVAEEWAVVDNLSGGRVGISFAPGWHADDFVLAPDPGVYGRRKDAMLADIEAVRAMWRGDPVTAANGVGREVEKRTYPRPVQPELPFWLTAAGNPETFRQAGELGARLLTHLLGQSVDELVDKIAVYRRAWRAAGHEGDGHVTLMVHAYVGTDATTTKKTVREPFRDYLRSSFGLVQALAPSLGIDGEPTEEDVEALLDHAFEHYYDGGALMGTLEECTAMAERLRSGGVDELACLIDFGIPSDDVLAGLPLLDQVRVRMRVPDAGTAEADYSVAAQIERHGVTHIQCTPSLAGILVADPATRQALSGVGTLLIGGEALPPALAAAVPCAALRNMYGPTETTIWSTTSLVTSEVSIGRPIANTTVYILDDDLGPLPVGVPGELYLGGLGVARGYLNRPGLTADRFRPSPYTPGARLYRTGDRARYLPDGRIEFLGRVDRQVKLGGHRIELGEIESVLLDHPAVRQAAVIADDHLVAYLVAAGTPPAPEELRKALLRTLPEVMVPAVLIWLDALPLNSSGKVDYQALPDPDSTEGQRSIRAAVTQARYVPPGDELEATIAGIWQDVLKVDQVGMRDTFFDLGGHSLMAIQMVSRLRAALGKEVTLRTVFESATVGDLAERVRAIDGGLPMTVIPPLLPAGREGVLPLSHAQQRMWFFDQLNPGITAYHLSAALRLRGDLDAGALRRAFNEIVGRHEVLRSNVALEDGVPVQVITPARRIPLPLIDVSGLPASEPEALRLALDEARKPFDLEHDALLRTTLVRVGAREHVLLLTTHHIVSDSWSIAVMARELGTLYAAYISGRPSPLPPLPVQYADYAIWQRDWLAGPVMDGLLAYWRDALEGAPPVMALPYDRPRPEVASYRGAQTSFQISAELSDGLKTLSARLDTTVFVILLAAFKALLHRWSGEERIVVGVPVAGRDVPELEPLIGLFGNATVLHTDVGGDPAFTELLGRVKDTVLGAYDHQSLPVDKLVADLGVERDLTQNPLFQVMFVYINDLQLAPAIAGLEVTPLDVHQGHVFMDLNLAMEESSDGLRGTVDYSTDLFNESTIRWLLDAFQDALAAVLEDPEIGLGELPLLPPPASLPVVIGSTFTAQSVEEPLAFWSERLDLPLSVSFAPYNQAFQQLLDPESAMAGNHDGVNVVMVRRQDWPGNENLDGDFTRALAAFLAVRPRPFVVVLCPDTDGSDDSSWRARFARVLEGLDGVYCLDAGAMAGLYGVEEFRDPVREEAANVPYTPEFFAALGTGLARQLSALTSSYPDTVVVDDMAGLPPRGFELMAEALVSLANQGRRVYVCANTLPSSLDHPQITAWADGRTLLEKLDATGAAAGECLFLSGDETLCAQVRAARPEILVLTYPGAEAELEAFLHHTWILDPPGLSFAEPE